MVEAHTQKAQGKRGDAHRRCCPRDCLEQLGARHVHEEHLDRQRRILIKLHVNAANSAQHTRTRGGKHTEQGAQDQRERQTGNYNLQRDEEAIPKASHLAKGHLPSHGIEESFKHGESSFLTYEHISPGRADARAIKSRATQMRSAQQRHHLRAGPTWRSLRRSSRPSEAS